MKRLSILGAGRVGTTLGALFARHRVFTIGEVRCRSQENADSAVRRIGSGTAVSFVEPVQPADLYLLSMPDDDLVGAASCLRQSNLLQPDAILFHCSGALSSRDLPMQGASLCASVHPVKSFADVDDSIGSFSGTWCAMEGDPSALHVLRPAFEQIGGKPFTIPSDRKLLYHIGCVFGCNYLTALLDVAGRCLSQSGVPEESALQVLQPLIEETVRNNVQLGSERALTGPIVRGDATLVGREYDQLAEQDPALAALYRDLGRITLQIAARSGRLDDEVLARLRSVLDPD